MDGVHNPDRFMQDLRQILSQGRKRIGLLIGAGAPISVRIDENRMLDASGTPLIPGVDDLTAIALAKLAGDDLTAIEAIKAELGDKPNIEQILSKVRLLQQAIGGAVVNDLNSDGYKALGQKICAEIGTVVGATLPDEHCAYNELVAWVSGTQRNHPVEIFTTNYDMLFEDAFESAKAPYFDGFSGGHAPFFDSVSIACDDLPARWSRLWKLHGSLGWQVQGDAVVRGGGRDATELVYPDHLKYDLTQKQPYSALFERLKQFMLTPDTLLIAIGFSFRDAHVNAVLKEALAQNANTAVFAFQYQELAKEMPVRDMAFIHPNLTVYAADAAVISGVAGKWRTGELPKNWAEIRASFWGKRWEDGDPVFLLGDFAKLTRFCALAQAHEIAARQIAKAEEAEADDEGDEDKAAA